MFDMGLSTKMLNTVAKNNVFVVSKMEYSNICEYPKA